MAEANVWRPLWLGKVGDCIELPMVCPSYQLLPLFNSRTRTASFKCLRSRWTDITIATVKFIPELVSYTVIQTISIERLWHSDLMFQVFNQTSCGIPQAQERGHLSANVFLHLTIHRKCIRDEFDRAGFESISRALCHDCEGDLDLESTPGIIGRVFVTLDLSIHRASPSLFCTTFGWVTSSCTILVMSPPAPIVVDSFLILSSVRIKLHINGLISRRWVDFVYVLYDMKINCSVVVTEHQQTSRLLFHFFGTFLVLIFAFRLIRTYYFSTYCLSIHK